MSRNELDLINAMSEELLCIMDNTPALQNRREYINIILKSTTHNHLPTYVHSMMVARLMVLMTKYFISHDPEKLVNVCGAASGKEAAERADEILEEAELAGLAHDVGKISFIPVVSVTSRRLTEGEFTLIKLHPAGGYRLLDKEGYLCIADVVRYHHKTYQGRGGYPTGADNTTSPYRFMIDICSIADTIDAATDSIGRSYQLNRTPDFIMDEIIAQAGERYNPQAAAALNDRDLRSSIRDALLNYRREAYYKAYIELGGAVDAAL
jgi:HD-GYP domain-containing protein (c-di-GMP phosphodiesterase class II)